MTAWKPLRTVFTPPPVEAEVDEEVAEDAAEYTQEEED